MLHNPGIMDMFGIHNDISHRNNLREQRESEEFVFEDWKVLGDFALNSKELTELWSSMRLNGDTGGILQRENATSPKINGDFQMRFTKTYLIIVWRLNGKGKRDRLRRLLSTAESSWAVRRDGAMFINLTILTFQAKISTPFFQNNLHFQNKIMMSLLSTSHEFSNAYYMLPQGYPSIMSN